MRRVLLPQAALGFAACVLSLWCLVSFVGCEKAQEAPSAPAQNPYAALDERFPEGRPGIADVAERAKDEQYQAKISAAGKNLLAAQQRVEVARQEAEHYHEEMRRNLSQQMGRPVPDVLLQRELEKNEHYLKLVAAVKAAEQALEATRAENKALIRERMRAPQEAYDEMKAQADAAARAAGVAVREEKTAGVPPIVEAPSSAKSASPVEKEKRVVPTVEALAQETGRPVAPKQEAK